MLDKIREIGQIRTWSIVVKNFVVYIMLSNDQGEVGKAGKIPMLRDRLIMDVKTGKIAGRHDLRRSAGMGSRGRGSF